MKELITLLIFTAMVSWQQPGEGDDYYYEVTIPGNRFVYNAENLRYDEGMRLHCFKEIPGEWRKDKPNLIYLNRPFSAVRKPGKAALKKGIKKAS